MIACQRGEIDAVEAIIMSIDDNNARHKVVNVVDTVLVFFLSFDDNETSLIL